MLAQLQGRHGDGGVHVIGHGDVDRVNGFLLVQQLAPILVDFHVREFFLDRVGVVEVNVGDGHQLEGGVAGQVLDVAGRHARGAEAGVEDGSVRRGGAQRAGQGGRGPQPGGGESGAAEELAAGDWSWHGGAEGYSISLMERLRNMTGSSWPASPKWPLVRSLPGCDLLSMNCVTLLRSQSRMRKPLSSTLIFGPTTVISS